METKFETGDVTIEEIACVDLPREQVLLNFANGDQGEAFCDWWMDTGIKLFKIHCDAGGQIGPREDL